MTTKRGGKRMRKPPGLQRQAGVANGDGGGQWLQPPPSPEASLIEAEMSPWEAMVDQLAKRLRRAPLT